LIFFFITIPSIFTKPPFLIWGCCMILTFCRWLIQDDFMHYWTHHPATRWQISISAVINNPSRGRLLSFYRTSL
jgi:hypothetical protein